MKNSNSFNLQILLFLKGPSSPILYSSGDVLLKQESPIELKDGEDEFKSFYTNLLRQKVGSVEWAIKFIELAGSTNLFQVDVYVDSPEDYEKIRTGILQGASNISYRTFHRDTFTSGDIKPD